MGRIHCLPWTTPRHHRLLPLPRVSLRSLSSIPTHDYVDETQISTKEPELLQQIVKRVGRPMTAIERFMHFPKGVRMLYYHCQRSQDIEDASRTRLNAWTIHHPLRKRTSRGTILVNSGLKVDDRPGRIPRRQSEQVRCARNDLQVVLPIVALYAIPIPILGYIPVALSILAPRQLLSSQFHNKYERVRFAHLEYLQRREEFSGLVDAFREMTAITHKPETIQTFRGHDATGPIIDGMQFHSVFAGHSGDFPTHRLRSVEMMPREYLVRFALSIGIFQSFPRPLNRMMAEIVPTPWIRSRVRQVVQDISHDDELLLQENHHEDSCGRLTDEEVLQACLIRNLPIDGTLQEMQTFLTNHLKMIESLKLKMCLPPSGPPTEGFGIFTMHLTIIRNYFRVSN